MRIHIFLLQVAQIVHALLQALKEVATHLLGSPVIGVLAGGSMEPGTHACLRESHTLLALETLMLLLLNVKNVRVSYLEFELRDGGRRLFDNVLDNDRLDLGMDGFAGVCLHILNSNLLYTLYLNHSLI